VIARVVYAIVYLTGAMTLFFIAWTAWVAWYMTRGG